jgi:hypothetical protein
MIGSASIAACLLLGFVPYSVALLGMK